MPPVDTLKRLLIFVAAIVGFSLGSAILPHPEADLSARWSAIVTAGSFAVIGALLFYIHERRAVRHAEEDATDS